MRGDGGAELDDQWLVDVVYVLHLIDLPIGTLANLLSHNKSLIDDGSLKFRAIESVNISCTCAGLRDPLLSPSPFLRAQRAHAAWSTVSPPVF